MNAKKMITDAIARAKKNGWRIIRGDWLDTSDNSRCCCPMTALLIGPEGEPPPTKSLNGLCRRAARKLGVSEACIQEFVMGFDDGWPNRVHHEAALLSKYGRSRDVKKYLQFFDLGREFKKRLRLKTYVHP